jgi:hypothetical protein
MAQGIVFQKLPDDSIEIPKPKPQMATVPEHITIYAPSIRSVPVLFYSKGSDIVRIPIVDRLLNDQAIQC